MAQSMSDVFCILYDVLLISNLLTQAPFQTAFQTSNGCLNMYYMLLLTQTQLQNACYGPVYILETCLVCETKQKNVCEPWSFLISSIQVN